jgi:hypothetical protein
MNDGGTHMSAEPRIEHIRIQLLDPNPFRPAEDEYDPEKIKVLTASFEANGVWESIIARPAGNRYQIAFGHHRLHTAKECKFKDIPVIISDLDDRQMLHYLADENAEEYGGSFDTQFQSWRAAEAYIANCPGRPGQPEDIDIAEELNWLRADDRGLNEAAYSCGAASRLIRNNHTQRATFSKLSIAVVRELTSVVEYECGTRDKLVNKRKMTQEAADLQKGCYYRSLVEVADGVRAGDIKYRDVRMKVRSLAQSKYGAIKELPEFRRAIDSLIKKIDTFFTEGKIADQLEHISDALPHLDAEDKQALNRLRIAFSHMEESMQRWRKTLQLRKPRLEKELTHDAA